MRTLLIGAAALLAGCATQAASTAAADNPPDKVQAVHQPDTPPRLPAPDRITLTSLYWGRVTQTWSIPRGGEGRWSEGEGPARTFRVTEADFDRLRDLFRPYEGVRFACRRVIADGPYGRVVWSQPGHEDQQLNWDAGCVTGDAADVFQRWDEAMVMLKALRDGG